MVDRVRVSAYEIDRWRISEGGAALPRVSFTPSFVAGIDFRQWNLLAGDAEADEGDNYTIRAVGDTRAKIRIELDVESEVSTTLAFTLTGTAVASTHYTLATASPLTIPAFQNFAEIWIEILEPAKFFTEKSIILTLDESGSSGLSVNTDADEFRLYIRPSVEPPTIEFDTSSQTAAKGANSVGLTLSAASLETTTIYYRESGTIDPSDYTITAGDESGSLTIAAGATTATLDFTIGLGASSGETLIFTLDHELNTVKHTAGNETIHVDENQWHFTDNWNFEQGPYGVGKEWPADPTMHGNAGLEDGQTKDFPDGETSLDVLPSLDDDAVNGVVTTPADTPSGTALQGITISALIDTNAGVGYIRESFEDQTKCGGPITLNSLKEYNRMALRFGKFSGADAWRNARFFHLTFRVRNKGTDHALVIDRESTGLDYLGNATTTWTVGSDTWGLWWSSNVIEDDNAVNWTTYGAAQQRFGGDGEVVASGGTLVDTFWMVHRLGGTYSGVLEEVGDLGNMIARPVWASAGADKTGENWRLPLESIGYGTPPYWPWFETDASVLTGIPTKFWRKLGRWWEPRGYAALDAADRLVHTYTVA